MYRNFLFSISLLAALGGTARADDPILQPDVIVTATRFAQTIDDTLADVSVITREDIEISGTRDISDLLRLQAGVDVARTGGAGGQTSVFLRGTNNNNVLVLVDGVRAASLSTGAFTWETLPLASIERIEIVRGPRASYWGSDAIGGVIQIFTRKLDGPRIAVGYGSYEDAKADVGIGQRFDQGGYSVQIGARSVGGFPSQNENGFGYEDKDHGLSNQHLGARADYTWGEQTLAGVFVRSQGSAEFAGGESNFTEQVFNGSVSGHITSAWQHRLNLGYDFEQYQTPAYFSQFETRRDSLGWQNEIALARSQRLILGIDYVNEQGENLDTFSNSPVYDESRNNTGLYAGWHAGTERLDSEVAVRFDDNSLFGTHWTGSAAAGWRFGDNARGYASYGEGFRGPTLNEQYSPGFGGLYAGNPDLQPEESRSAEIGLEFSPATGQQIKVNAYSTRITNLISFTGVDFQAENIAKARIDGVELAYEKQAGSWQMNLAYTWQDPRNEDSGTPLLRRPEQKFAGSLDRVFGESGRFGIELFHSGERQDVAGIKLQPYTLVNLRGSWDFSPQWSVVARAENIGNVDYELAYGYNTPGRSILLEVVWSGD
ncbi:TonB-dependent receptor domain-containing protein [Dokdonella sp.]|uniref:TonB-dependent receptor domain-containing protein n=1 Tax=Dokdonella sp. TaxID=2291710 RepID=UPI003528E361